MKRQWQPAFLTALGLTGSVAAAAEEAKIGGCNAYEHKRTDRWSKSLGIGHSPVLISQ
jgi:hypothetical protein